MNLSKILKTVIIFLLSITLCSAQNFTYQKTKNGIEGKTETGFFRISVYSDYILRVQFSKENKLETFSYSLVNNELPSFSDFQISENQSKIFIKTSAIHAEINLQPFGVIFKNNKDEIINEDLTGKGLGTQILGNKITVYKKLQEGEKFVGLGEQLGNLNRTGTVVTNKNTDNYKYDDPRIPMYVSIPFFMGFHHDKMYGIYFDNSFRSVFNFGASNTRFSSYAFDGGDLDEFFMYDNSVEKILQHYTSLTGRMELPPKWSIGYHQSRCSYFPENQVLNIANTFKNKNIPIDCVVLDADYLHQYEPFRINKERFPDMKNLSQKLQKMGIELTASVNPGIKIDETYDAYKTGLKSDVFLKYQDGEIYKTEIYPNMNHYPDFSSPKTRNWWAENMKIYQDVGINGYWNDMNEPAINGQAMPDNVVFDCDGRTSNPLEMQNYYGFLMARSSYESFKKFGGNKRPFILTRSGFAGIQRYSAVWSGDNQAKDEHILLGCLLNNQLGLAGVPFTGPDLGGYIGDGNKDLYKRWVEIGVFSPFLRNHREYFANANEPWSYGEEAEAISKSYIGFRYRLMPYLYSKFYETSQSGIPISRSLCIDFPFDEKVYSADNQNNFLFGDAFLLVPLTSKETAKKVYLPKGNWYDFFSDEKLLGNQEYQKNLPNFRIPIYVKESSIIPMQSHIYSTKEQPDATLQIHIYFGEKENSFTYYEDDGESLDYLKGNFYKREIVFDSKNNQLIFNKKEGDFDIHFKKIKLIFHGFDRFKNFKINNYLVETQNEIVKVLDPLEFLKDYYSFDENYLKNLIDSEKTLPSKTITTDFSADKFVVSWK